MQPRQLRHGAGIALGCAALLWLGAESDGVRTAPTVAAAQGYDPSELNQCDVDVRTPEVQPVLLVEQSTPLASTVEVSFRITRGSYTVNIRDADIDSAWTTLNMEQVYGVYYVLKIVGWNASQAPLQAQIVKRRWNQTSGQYDADVRLWPTSGEYAQVLTVGDYYQSDEPAKMWKEKAGKTNNRTVVRIWVSRYGRSTAFTMFNP